jgi:hypothetical protein
VRRLIWLLSVSQAFEVLSFDPAKPEPKASDLPKLSVPERPPLSVIDATAMTDMNEVIFKADRRGRLRFTPEQKQALVEAYEGRGLCCLRFAALQAVNSQNLVSWLKKRRQGDSDHLVLRSLEPSVFFSPGPRWTSGLQVVRPAQHAGILNAIGLHISNMQ